MPSSRGRNLPAPRDIPPVLDPAARPVPQDRRLPPHQSKRERVVDHVAAISADLREFVELRIALAKAEVKEKVDDVKASAQKQARPFVFFAGGAFVGLYFIGFTFALLAAGFAWIFGSHEVFAPTFFGILVAWALLLLGTVIPLLIGKRMMDQNEVEARLAEPPPAEPESPRPTRADIQNQERTHAQQSAV